MTTEQRSKLKVLVRLRVSTSEAFYMLQQMYKEQTLPRLTVFRCHRRFKKGSEDVEDDPREEGLPPVQMKAMLSL